MSVKLIPLELEPGSSWQVDHNLGTTWVVPNVRMPDGEDFFADTRVTDPNYVEVRTAREYNESSTIDVLVVY